jgi:hypothetical protein
MKSIARRLSKLENPIGVTKELFLVVLSDAGRRSLDDDACVRILREGGFLPAGGVAMVDLFQIPVGLNAEETKMFVRQNGAEICRSRAAQTSAGSEVKGRFEVRLA